MARHVATQAALPADVLDAVASRTPIRSEPCRVRVPAPVPERSAPSRAVASILAIVPSNDDWITFAYSNSQSL